MLRITFRTRVMNGNYKCIETIHTILAHSYFTPAGTSLVYIKRDRFNTTVIAKEDIISIENL